MMARPNEVQGSEVDLQLLDDQKAGKPAGRTTELNYSVNLIKYTLANLIKCAMKSAAIIPIVQNKLPIKNAGLRIILSVAAALF